MRATAARLVVLPYAGALRSLRCTSEVVEPARTVAGEGVAAMTTIRGERAGGLRSDAGQAAYWRMQWESCQEALAMVMAENTENVEALRDVVADYGDACEHPEVADCAMSRARRLVAHMTMVDVIRANSAPTPAGPVSDDGGAGRG